jgi:hypothetical protein
MKVYYLDPPVEILDYEKTIGEELVVRERPKHIKAERFYAHFESLAIQDGSVLLFAIGNGNTVDAAIADYCTKISGKKGQINIIPQESIGDVAPDFKKDINIPGLVYTAQQEEV